MACNIFFNTNDQTIPKEYQLPFQKLAERAGNTNTVDSCDMESFYTEIGASSNQRLTSPSSFTKEEWQWGEFGYVKVFDYEKFYGHLSTIVMAAFNSAMASAHLNLLILLIYN